MCCRAYQDSGSWGPTSNPNMELERKRSGFTRRTGSTWEIADSGGGAGEIAGAIAGAYAGAASGFLDASAATTRRVISSTIDAIEASSATVTAARTCSSSTTAMNGAAAGFAP